MRSLDHALQIRCNYRHHLLVERECGVPPSPPTNRTGASHSAPVYCVVRESAPVHYTVGKSTPVLCTMRKLPQVHSTVCYSDVQLSPKGERAQDYYQSPITTTFRHTWSRQTTPMHPQECMRPRWWHSLLHTSFGELARCVAGSEE